MNPLASLVDRLTTAVRRLYDRMTRPRMKQATVYAREGRLYVCSASETVLWLWIATPPFLTTDAEETSDEALGRLVRQALDASRQGLRQPSVKELETVADPLIRLAGVKSYRTFEKGAHCLEIHEQEGALTITPTRNAGKDGFIEATEREAKLAADAGPAELGKAVRDGLKRCQ
jgi:hypothetical protein